MIAIFDHKEEHNPNTYSFWFRPEKPINNVPGQFTEIYLPHTNPDNRGEKRWFTIYSSPTEELIAITTKIISESSSFKKTLQSIKPGTELQFSEPMGDFVLPKDSSIPLVFVAGGIGITPFRSIVRWLTDKKQTLDIQLLYAANSQSDFIENKLFSKIKSKYIISKPSSSWNGLSGRLTADKILELTINNAETYFYISGPENMVESLTKDLIKKGQPEHQVISDYFPGYSHL